MVFFPSKMIFPRNSLSFGGGFFRIFYKESLEPKLKKIATFLGGKDFFERKLLAWGFDVLFVPTLTDLGNSSF